MGQRDFRAQHVFVPARVQRQLVVGNDQRPLLRWRKVGQRDDRDFLHSQLPGCEKSGVPQRWDSSRTSSFNDYSAHSTQGCS